MALHEKFDALRQQEIATLKADVGELAANVRRLDARLAGPGAS